MFFLVRHAHIWHFLVDLYMNFQKLLKQFNFLPGKFQIRLHVDKIKHREFHAIFKSSVINLKA